jgi:hypothetical protein
MRKSAVALVLAGVVASGMVAVRADDDQGQRLALCTRLSTTIEYLTAHPGRLSSVLLRLAEAASARLGC